MTPSDPTRWPTAREVLHNPRNVVARSEATKQSPADSLKSARRDCFGRFRGPRKDGQRTFATCSMQRNPFGCISIPCLLCSSMREYTIDWTGRQSKRPRHAPGPFPHFCRRDRRTSRAGVLNRLSRYSPPSNSDMIFPTPACDCLGESQCRVTTAVRVTEISPVPPPLPSWAPPGASKNEWARHFVCMSTPMM